MLTAAHLQCGDAQGWRGHSGRLQSGVWTRQAAEARSLRAAKSRHPTHADHPFFYGGSWNSGTKDDYSFVGRALASRGCLVAIADDRLVPHIRYPAFLEDNAAAFHWLRRYAMCWGGLLIASFWRGIRPAPMMPRCSRSPLAGWAVTARRCECLPGWPAHLSGGGACRADHRHRQTLAWPCRCAGGHGRFCPAGDIIAPWSIEERQLALCVLTHQVLHQDRSLRCKSVTNCIERAPCALQMPRLMRTARIPLSPAYGAA